VTARIREALAGAVLASAAAASPAVCETARPWLDPPLSVQPPAPSSRDLPSTVEQSPLNRSAPAQPSPPVRSAEPPREVAPDRDAAAAARPGSAGVTEKASLEKAARQLAVDYLDFWSAPNPLALDTMSAFYGPTVEFHGREIGARALMEKKRRFVRRWPVRAYMPHFDTLWTACDRSEELCTVRTAFDFTAINPERRRRSQGSGSLELQISFAGDRPVIVSEASRVVRGDACAERSRSPTPRIERSARTWTLRLRRD
jgi:hypothetical protein